MEKLTNERFAEIIRDKEICEFCEDCGNDDICINCKKVKPATVKELRLFWKELSALVKARDEGWVVVLEDVTVHQANTIIGMCERLNAMKARRGDDQEPLITWQLYNALLISFTRAEAETALGGGGDG